jgi:hypothetical protein
VDNQIPNDRIYTVSRPFNDDFTYDLFVDLTKFYSGHKEAYYLWSAPAYTSELFLKHAPFSSPVVFIGIKDLLAGWHNEEFDWWKNKRLSVETLISNMVKKHADKKFILFVSMENLDHTLSEPNLHIIPWGGDWVNQKTEYSRMQPVLDKNFNSDRTYISLNRNVRSHRLVTLSYLFGKKYDCTGVITYLKNHNMPDSFLDTVSWEFGPDHDELRTTVLEGFECLKSSPALASDDYDVYRTYGTAAIDNAGNFENRLRSMYRNSFVEIVSESVFTPPSFIITEKTANSFFGCNFPIILGGCGIIAHLREIGFDMFDDVVDHSYDQIANPFDRIVSAIESNRRLLIDSDHAKQSWRRCHTRFEHNVQTVRNIYAWYEHRAKTKFARVMQSLSR